MTPIAADAAKSELEALRATGFWGARLAAALRRALRPPPIDTETFQRIEAERATLRKRTDPLVDGSLGPAGHYDREQTVGFACAKASIPPRQAPLLYALVREFQSQSVVELGTNVGISTAYFGAGMAANGKGRVTTLDVSPYRLRVARQLHAALGLANIDYVEGSFEQALGGALEELPPIDLAFVDGDHSYAATLGYFDILSRRAFWMCVFVFDDIRWSDEMSRAWSDIAADQRCSLVADLGRLGVCVILPSGMNERASVAIPIDPPARAP